MEVLHHHHQSNPFVIHVPLILQGCTPNKACKLPEDCASFMQVSPTTFTDEVLGHYHMALQNRNSVKTSSKAPNSPEFKEKLGKQNLCHTIYMHILGDRSSVSSLMIHYALVSHI